ncbi:non-ribosomal peptide synthetase [uncultured Kordia sp.]|uniref:non-ribosomal peptide synthetase n=1 Tax=uncultured Kordia sp. TaxID=507699 RepID=UPI002611ED17|nr:non-ribosomal peptide synthetase [uncultured Kordia sp.]
MEKAKQLISKLEKQKIDLKLNGENLEIVSYQSKVPVELIHEIKALKQDLIQYLKTLDIESKTIEIPVCEEAENYALSSAQYRLWIAMQHDKNTLTYNMPAAIYINEKVDLKAFETAIKQTIAKHEILRTVFKPDQAGIVKQWIQPTNRINFTLDYIDVRNTNDQEATITAYLEEKFKEHFNLENGPLLKAGFIHTQDKQYILYFNMHHIISDGWSIGVLQQEVFSFYQNPIGTEKQLRIQYKDFAAWETKKNEAGINEENKKYWIDTFVEEVPLLNLPSNKRRPEVKSNNGNNLSVDLSFELTNNLRAYVNKAGVSVFTGVLASLKLMLSTYSNVKDITVGTPIAGRNHVDLENQIGFYVNMLPLRTKIEKGETFASFLKKEKKAYFNAIECPYPFNQLIEELQLKRDISRNPLFDVSLTYYGAQDTMLEKQEVPFLKALQNKSVRYDIEFHVREFENKLKIEIIYDTDVYEKEMFVQFLENYTILLSEALQNVTAEIETLNIISKEEQLLFNEFNQTTVAYPRDESIISLFEKQALETPNHKALVFEKTEFTYAELNAEANQLARCLVEIHQLVEGDFIGILANRNEQAIIAMLAILKIGCTYAVIDAESPKSRLEYILKDINPKLLITDTDHVFEIDYFNGNMFVIDIEFQKEAFSSENLETLSIKNRLAYIAYTSGSTGVPKGVMVTNRGVVRLVKNTNFITVIEEDNYLGLSNFSFDGSTFDIYMPLLNGATVCIASKSLFLDLQRLNNYIIDNEITSFFITPVLFNSLVDFELSGLANLKYVICGGDRVSVKHAKKFNELYPKVSLQNGYGPTENTTFSTWYKIENLTDTALSIPIGPPIANSQCYIVNEALKLLPLGVIGEICVGGDGLAEGYLNQPELTAEKFVSNPFKTETKLYKTGDLGRWNANGEIEFFGRNDHQVKIRGYRIELGEIEHALLKIENIDKGAIIIVEDASKQKNIVAYFTAKESQNIQKLEAALKEILASYMVPNHFIQIDEMPLTLNGKVDRKALLSIEGNILIDTDNYKAPTTKLEANIVTIWNTYFKREDLGVAHDFFAIGGDSIKAIQLINKMNTVFDEGYFTIADLYANPTIEALVKTAEVKSNVPKHIKLRKSISQEFTTLQENTISEAAKKGTSTENWEAVFPMGGIQKGLIFHSLLDNGVYILSPIQQFENEGFKFEIFKKALKEVVAEHPILRTSFNLHEFGQELQIVHKNLDLEAHLEFLDIRSEIEEIQNNIIKEIIHNQTENGFDIAISGLWKAIVIQLSEDVYKLIFLFHHAILDGWSYYSMITEISKKYEEKKNNQPTFTAPIQLSYRDYIVEEFINKENTKLKEYWTKKFSDFEINDLPFHAKSEAVAISEYIHIKLDTKLKNQVDAYIKRAKISEKTFYLAVALKLIQVTTNQNDITIGLMSNGRQALEDGDKVLGCFTNSLPFRIHLEKENTSFINAIEQQIRELKEFESLSYFELKKILSETYEFKKEYFNATYNFTDFHITKNINKAFKGQEVLIQESEKSETAFNFHIASVEEEVLIEMSFYEGLYSEIQKAQLENYVHNILTDFITTEQNISIITESEQTQLLEAFNNTKVNYGEGKTVLDVFADQVAKNPNVVAITFEEITLSYQELDAKSNQIANYLAKQNLQANSLIPLCIERSVEMIIGIFGILKAGFAYVPIDPTNPQTRIDFILEDISAEIILTESSLENRFVEANQTVISLDVLSFENEGNTFESEVNEDQLAYIIYTSGTTGIPKGVMIEHKSLFNFIHGFSELYDFSAAARIGFKTNYAFDVSVHEIFGWIKDGGSVVILPEDAEKEAKGLIERIEKYKITHLNLVPSLFSVLLEELQFTDKEALSSLEYFFLAGEALPIQLVRNYDALGFEAKLENIYGPTEATIYSSYYSTENLTDDQTSIPIGKPTLNTQLYILDEQLSLVPSGVIGELCISGKGLSKGYLNREELTEEKFVNHPFKEGKKLYKTGDLAKWLPDGNIAYIGRKDDQVKIRGYRIELGEIENVIRECSSTITSVVVTPKEIQQDKILVAYIVSEELEKSTLKQYLQSKLPSYMVPSYFIVLDELPLNKSGKIDRKALPKLTKDALIETKEYIAATNEIEAKLVAILEEMLTISPIGITDNFFELGGNSLSALQLRSKITQTFNTKIDLRGFFNVPTIQYISAEIELAENDTTHKAFSIIPVAPSQKSYELSYAQKRFWVLNELSGQSAAYNLFVAQQLDTEFDLKTLNKAIQIILERHASLRTIFVIENGIPKQQIQAIESVQYVVEKYQYDAENVKDEVFNTVFELDEWPLFRMAVIEETNELVFSIHHIISDGWSLEIFKNDIVKIYESLRSKMPIELPELAIEYKDYAVWEQNLIVSEAIQPSKNYWEMKLQAPLGQFQLPYDVEVETKTSHNEGSYYNVLLQGEAKDKLVQFSLDKKLRLLSILMASFKIVLQRLTNENDLIIGVPMSVRSHVELQHQIGVFLNTVLIRNTISANQTTLGFLTEVNNSLLEAIDNQLYPYEKVVEGIQNTELTSVFFNLLNYDGSAKNTYSESEAITGKLETAVKFDIECYVKEYANAISISCVYRDAVFKSETIKHWMDMFVNVINAVVEQPNNTIGEIPVFTRPIYQLEKKSKANSKLTIEQSIIKQFEAQVEKAPNALAIHSEHITLRYGDINNIANKIANQILAKEISNKRVSLLLARGELQILGILGTLKSGNSYVPLDSEYPIKRLLQLVEASKSKILVTSETNRVIAETISEKLHIPIVVINTTNEKVIENPLIKSTSTDEAYVLFTSGSTGIPKGVIQNQRNVLYFIKKHIQNVAVTENDTVSLLSTYSFDAYVVDVFSTLLVGGTIAPYNIKTTGLHALNTWMQTYKVSILHMVPSLFRAFTNILKQDEKVVARALVLGGEAAFQKDFNSFKNRFSTDAIFVNIYGAAEASIISTKVVSHESELYKNRIPLGNITEDNNVYILQNDMLTQDIYATGEIVYKSEHTTIGYLNATNSDKEEYYKTGDIGRILATGELEFIERSNQQIKLNGIRIDLLEIELNIQKIASQTAVIVQDNKLISYLLETEKESVSAIKKLLKEELPQIMIPEIFVFVAEFPRTRTGKIDRKSLPNAIITETNETLFEAPSNTIEKELVTIWQKLLKLETVGIQHSFFELGGHSLLAIQLIAHMQATFEVVVSIKDIFENPTIKDLGIIIAEKVKVSIPAIIPTKRTDKIPLSYAQERLWFIDKLQGSLAYHIPGVLQIKGKIDTTILSKAIQALVIRHETLRTVIHEYEGDGYQYIMNADDFEVVSVASARLDKNLDQFIQEETQKTFDLSQDYMLRATIVKQSENTYMLILVLHHIAADGWSIPIFVNELEQAYRQISTNGKVDLQPLSIQYADYSNWQRNYLTGEVLGEKLSFWINQLKDVMPLVLPTDYNRPAIQSTAGETYTFKINKALSNKLNIISKSQGVTLFMTLLTIYKVLLHRYSGQTDIAVGTPIANRSQLEISQLIGFFINTIVMRSQVESQKSFAELLQEIKQTSLAAFTHQDVPFEKIVDHVVVDRDQSRSPLFQTMFILQNNEETTGISLGESNIELLETKTTTAKFDISMTIRENENGMSVAIEYVTALFKKETIARFAVHFNQLVKAVCENVNQSVGSLQMLPKAEKTQLLEAYNNTKVNYGEGKTVLDVFADQVAKNPNAVAITFEEITLSYQELDAKSNQIANYLAKQNLQANSLIPLCIERSLEMIIGIFGILKAGFAYVPIDPTNPQTRIDFILEDISAEIILTESSLENRFVEANQMIISLDVLSFENEENTFESEVNEDQLAYIIYTSGTTGIPKGVMIEHKSLFNFIHGFSELYDFSAAARIGFKTNYAFDVSVHEIFGWIKDGGSVVILPKDAEKEAKGLIERIEKYKITHLNLVPSLFSVLLEELQSTDKEALSSLEYFFLAGEALPIQLVRNYDALGFEAKLENIYGPTEATIYSSYYSTENLTDDQTSIPIGKPTLNTQLYILDEQLSLVPSGVIGELCISGKGLSKGYLNREELTEEKFVNHPFKEGEKLYKTGDLAKWLPDGNIAYIGRKDDQVKIRGYRIELGEIETALDKLENIKQSVVVAKEDNTGSKQLVAYFIAEEEIDFTEIQESLASELPNYMIPNRFMQLEEFPLNANGKINKKELPELDTTALKTTTYEAPTTETEKQLVAIWEELLGIENIGIKDNFFQLGGHSLLAIKLITRISKTFETEISVKEVFHFVTIEEIAKYLEIFSEQDQENEDEEISFF